MFKNVHPLSGYAEQKRLFLSTIPQATDLAGHDHLQATAVMANALPCLYEPLADTDGVPLGKTLSGEMVHLNLWGRETENWNVLGSGVIRHGQVLQHQPASHQEPSHEPLRHDYRQIPIV